MYVLFSIYCVEWEGLGFLNKKDWVSILDLLVFGFWDEIVIFYFYREWEIGELR